MALALSVLLAACSPPPASTGTPSRRSLGPPPASRTAAPVDTDRITLAEAQRWLYRRAVDADLDADGSPERIVLTADVQVNAAGVALWEDGHRWAVIVEDGGERTLVYGAFLPNGHAEAAVLIPDSTKRRDILVRERAPDQSRVLVIAYEKPGAARTVSAAYDQVEEWVAR